MAETHKLVLILLPLIILAVGFACRTVIRSRGRDDRTIL
jgi:hypothetical protein